MLSEELSLPCSHSVGFPCSLMEDAGLSGSQLCQSAPFGRRSGASKDQTVNLLKMSGVHFPG